MTFGDARPAFVAQNRPDEETYLAGRDTEASLEVEAMNRSTNAWTQAQAPDVFSKGIEG